jgi:hypothetical protein
MKRSVLIAGVVVLISGSYALGAGTSPSLVATYSSLADTILGAKATELHLVHAILDSHYAAAASAAKSGSWEDAAAEIALFANEGDNAVGGIRKRLLEGGHHHHAEEESKGVYEAGYVIVTVAAKKEALAAAAAIRAAQADDARKAAWAGFEKVAESLLRAK